jgi:aminoglycoside phosphotransferase (APT) family kinase protein
MNCPAAFLHDPAAFEAALAAVPGAAGDGGVHALSPLPAGGINASYLVATARGQFVLRLADVGPRAELLGVDRERERILHDLAAGAGLAPPVLARSGDGRWQVRPFVRGVHWSGDDFDSPRQIERLGAALRRLQAIPVPRLARFDPRGIMGRWAETLSQRSPADAQALIGEFKAACAALEQIDAARRAPCIVHSDLHGANILDGDGLCFIDWEYAQVADPLCECGSLLAAHPQLERHAELLLDVAGLAHRAEYGELSAWTVVYRCLNSFWRRLAWEP